MIITLSSDFAAQSQGVGIMEAVIYEINPKARVVHLMHGLPDFDYAGAAWAMESVCCIAPGCHVCVVDPGVGTERRAVIIKTLRGDLLIGPDNGVLVPASRILGVKKAAEIRNEKYMRSPVSAVFHGRDIFAPAAAHISMGARIEDFGPAAAELHTAPYEEARQAAGRFEAQVIHINKFGSVHLNILQSEFDLIRPGIGELFRVRLKGRQLSVPYQMTFGDVEKGKILLFKDDYLRMELALNRDNLAGRYGLKTGDRVTVEKMPGQRVYISGGS